MLTSAGNGRHPGKTGAQLGLSLHFLRDRDRNAQAMAIHRCVRSTTPTNHTASDRNKTILQRQSAGAKALFGRE